MFFIGPGLESGEPPIVILQLVANGVASQLFGLRREHRKAYSIGMGTST